MRMNLLEYKQYLTRPGSIVHWTQFCGDFCSGVYDVCPWDMSFRRLAFSVLCFWSSSRVSLYGDSSTNTSIAVMIVGLYHCAQLWAWHFRVYNFFVKIRILKYLCNTVWTDDLIYWHAWCVKDRARRVWIPPFDPFLTVPIIYTLISQQNRCHITSVSANVFELPAADSVASSWGLQSVPYLPPLSSAASFCKVVLCSAILLRFLTFFIHKPPRLIQATLVWKTSPGPLLPSSSVQRRFVQCRWALWLGTKSFSCIALVMSSSLNSSHSF